MAGRLGPLAQLVEQGTLNPKVAGSIPARPMPMSLQKPRVLRVAPVVPDGTAKGLDVDP